MSIPVGPSLLQNEVQILNAKPRKNLIGSGGDLKEKWWEERTGSSSLNFFQVVFTSVVESSQPLAAESRSPM